MNTIIITSEEFLIDESALINALFEAGLSCLHIRKPNSETFKIIRLIEEISNKFYDKIFLHGHLDLVKYFGFGGFHLTENSRNNLSLSIKEIIINSVKNKEFLLSTSFHNDEEMNSEKLILDHAFLSPVYNSISKKNYKASNFKFPINKNKIDFDLYALGGITNLNINETIDKGFDGVTLLGYIWEEPSKSLVNYLKVKELCQKRDLSY